MFPLDAAGAPSGTQVANSSAESCTVLVPQLVPVAMAVTSAGETARLKVTATGASSPTSAAASAGESVAVSAGRGVTPTTVDSALSPKLLSAVTAVW